MSAESKLKSIENLVKGVGRNGRQGNGIDMLADAIQRILDEPDTDE